MSEALAIRPGFDNPTRVPAREEALEPGAVRAQLERVLASKTFSRSPRISRFLAFVVDQTLAGQEDKLKEYLLGVEVFNRMDTFDPRIDSIVRVEARRLRYKLERYYETEGQNDTVLIQFRKGCYVPTFSNRNQLSDDLFGTADAQQTQVIGNPQAFALFARARYNMGRWTPQGISESIASFSQALDEDPDCVGAYSGLGAAWVIAAALGSMSCRECMPKARERAEQAIVLRPNMAEPHCILGFVRAAYDWEWNEAEPILRRGVQFAPHESAPRLWYALYSALAGRSDRAMHEAHRAQQASPTSLAAHMMSGFACYMAGNHDEAVIQFRLAESLDSAFFPAGIALGLLLTDQDAADRAIEALNAADSTSPGHPLTLAALAYAHSRAGRPEEAARYRDELEGNAADRYTNPVARALAAVSVSDIDAGARCLDQALEERSMWLACVPAMRAFQPLHATEAYNRVIEALRLPHHRSPVIEPRA